MRSFFFVEVGGFEPPSKQAAKMFSTRLAFVEFSFVFLVKSQPKHNLFSVVRMVYRNLYAFGSTGLILQAKPVEQRFFAEAALT